MNIIDFPKDTSPEDLADGLLEYSKQGNVKWVVMVICEKDETLRFEWSRLPSNLAAIGAVEFLKTKLMNS